MTPIKVYEFVEIQKEDLSDLRGSAYFYKNDFMYGYYYEHNDCVYKYVGTIHSFHLFVKVTQDIKGDLVNFSKETDEPLTSYGTKIGRFTMNTKNVEDGFREVGKDI